MAQAVTAKRITKLRRIGVSPAACEDLIREVERLWKRNRALLASNRLLIERDEEVLTFVRHVKMDARRLERLYGEQEAGDV